MNKFIAKKKHVIKIIAVLFLLVAVSMNLSSSSVYAQGVLNMDINGNNVETLEILMLLTFITLLPSIAIMMTSFTRILIVLSFLRTALGIQQAPPNQVLIGIAIFLTLFIMTPVIDEINTTAYQPYINDQITQEEFYGRAEAPIKKFMLMQTGDSEVQMYVDMSKDEQIKNVTNTSELPLTIVVPAFMTSELKRAFTIGFLLFIPFLVIDMIVASVLMSMGMIMLPPVMISLPFKLLIFVIVDGWGLLFKTLIATFNF